MANTQRVRIPSVLQKVVKIYDYETYGEVKIREPVLVLDTREEDLGLYRALHDGEDEKLLKYTADHRKNTWLVILTTDPESIIDEVEELGIETERLFKNLSVIKTDRISFYFNSPEDGWAVLKQIGNAKFLAGSLHSEMEHRERMRTLRNLPLHPLPL